MCFHISSTIKDSNNPNSHLSRDGGREGRLIRPSKKCKPSTVLALEFLPGFESLRATGTPGLNCSMALEGINGAPWSCQEHSLLEERCWGQSLRHFVLPPLLFFGPWTALISIQPMLWRRCSLCTRQQHGALQCTRLLGCSSQSVWARFRVQARPCHLQLLISS